MKYLFLCAMGKKRSPIAARVASEIAQERGLKDLEMDYEGFDRYLPELNDPTLRERHFLHFNEYSQIYVMDNYMKDALIGVGIDRRKISCLNISDDEHNPDDPKDMRRLEDLLDNILRTYIGISLWPPPSN